MIILTLKQTQPKHEVQRFSNIYNNNYIFEWKRRTTLIVGYEYPDSVNFGLKFRCSYFESGKIVHSK